MRSERRKPIEKNPNFLGRLLTRFRSEKISNIDGIIFISLIESANKYGIEDKELKFGIGLKTIIKSALKKHNLNAENFELASNAISSAILEHFPTEVIQSGGINTLEISKSTRVNGKKFQQNIENHLNNCLGVSSGIDGRS
ncbi:MAG: hypothetical protein ACJAW3_000211 [Lentimonas sp.]|jgi:hypothetical protein